MQNVKKIQKIRKKICIYQKKVLPLRQISVIFDKKVKLIKNNKL